MFRQQTYFNFQGTGFFASEASLTALTENPKRADFICLALNFYKIVRYWKRSCCFYSVKQLNGAESQVMNMILQIKNFV